MSGWVSQQCIVNATFGCLPGNNVVRMSHVSGSLLIRLLHVFEFIATQCFYHCVLGEFLVVVLVGLLPRSLFALLSLGW